MTDTKIRYKRISTGLNNYKLYPITDNFNIYEYIDIAQPKDYYVGVYEYEQRHVDNYRRTNSLAGIRDVTTSCLIFDFDEQPEKRISIANAQDSTVALVDRLIELGTSLNDIQIYFSGNKGFHVQIDTAHRFDREHFTNIVYSLAQGLLGFDTRIIDQQRLIRIPFSTNISSGLRKIPVSFVELKNLTVGEIRSLATFEGLNIPEERATMSEAYTTNVKLDDRILSLVYVDEKQPKEKPALDDQPGDYLDLTKKPQWMDAPRYALQEGFFVEGQRNTALMILAAFYKSQGLDESQAFAFLSIVAEKQAKKNGSKPFPDREIQTNIIDFVYSPHWNGGIYSKEHDLLQEKEIQFSLSRGTDGDSLVTIGEVFATMFEEANGLDDHRLSSGIKEIDREIILLKGMAFGILGSPGSGKTSIINQIVRNMALSGKKVLYESLDMQRSMQGLKFLNQYLAEPITMVELNARIRQDPEEFKRTLDKARAGFDNIYFNYAVSSVENIIKHIEGFRSKHGTSPDLVVVDYLEKIRGPSNDPMRDMNHIIPRITDAAKEYKTCIALLLQPQKSSDGRNLEIDSPLTMRNIKGSSIIEQDLRVIFSLWRPGARTGERDDDRFLKLAVVKNNMGPQPTLSFHWNGPRGIITTLSDHDREALDIIEASNNSRRGSGGSDL